MLKSGYIYWCCARGQYNMVKNGFTTKADVLQYCVEQYSRTMVPLEMIAVTPVADARLMERVAHHITHQYRLHERHEMFDYSSGAGMLDRDRLDKVISIINYLTVMSGMSLPEPVEVITAQKLHDAEQRRIRREECETAEIIEKVLTKVVKNVALRHEDEAVRLAQEKRRLEAKRKRVSGDCPAEVVNDFLRNHVHYTGMSTDRVSQKEMYEAYKTCTTGERYRKHAFCRELRQQLEKNYMENIGPGHREGFTHHRLVSPSHQT
jgi:hypothetical protein